MSLTCLHNKIYGEHINILLSGQITQTLAGFLLYNFVVHIYLFIYLFILYYYFFFLGGGGWGVGGGSWFLDQKKDFFLSYQ